MSVLVRVRKGHREAEIKVCCHKPGDSRNPQELEKARNNSSLEPPEGVCLANTGFQISGL